MTEENNEWEKNFEDVREKFLDLHDKLATSYSHPELLIHLLLVCTEIAIETAPSLEVAEEFFKSIEKTRNNVFNELKKKG